MFDESNVCPLFPIETGRIARAANGPDWIDFYIFIPRYKIFSVMQFIRIIHTHTHTYIIHTRLFVFYICWTNKSRPTLMYIYGSHWRRASLKYWNKGLPGFFLPISRSTCPVSHSFVFNRRYAPPWRRTRRRSLCSRRSLGGGDLFPLCFTS